MRKQFNEAEIPYNQLLAFGITREMFLDLPAQAMKHIVNGRPSPLLKLSTADGKVMAAKVRLTRNMEGKVSFVFIPRRRELDVSRHGLTPKEVERLKKDEVILKDGMYIRLDRETNQLLEMKVSEAKIDKRIESIVNAIEDVQLGENQKQQIREGKPVTISRGDTEITIGIDMNATSGVKVIKGGLDEWRQKMMVEWDRITPGATGYWQTTQNGWEFTKELERNNGKTVEAENARGQHSKYSYSLSNKR